MSLAGGTVALFDAQSFAAALAADGRAKTLVVGGGAFALGYALAHREDALVLERGIHLAADFACTCGPQKLGTPKTSLGRELRDGLASCGILNGEHLELPPLADYMGAFFADHGGRAFMNAEPPEGPVTRIPAGMPMSASATESPVSSSDLHTTSMTMDESPRNMNHETSRRATMFQCAPSAPITPGVHRPMRSASTRSSGREM